MKQETPQLRGAPARDGGDSDLSVYRSTPACDCSVDDREFWYGLLFDEGRKDDDIARLVPAAERHLEEGGEPENSVRAGASRALAEFMRRPRRRRYRIAREGEASVPWWAR